MLFSAPTGYVSEWYDNKSSQMAATIITATGGVTLTNINAQLAASTVGPAGAITGTVTAADTGLPLNMWVYAYNSGGSQAGSSYATGGAYVLSNLSAGAYRVYFSGSSPYPGRYYNNKPNLAAANVVTVTSGVTVTNINQVLKPGGIITGVVTGSGGVPGVLVTAYRVVRRLLESHHLHRRGWRVSPELSGRGRLPGAVHPAAALHRRMV